VVIEAVRVAADERGTGLGSRYIRWAIDWSRGAGARLLQLTSSNSRVDARRFYEGLGFRADHVGLTLSLATRSG
jgi:GNAT superfamily N-acetyltransferase